MNRSRERFIDNRFLQLALGCYVVFWIALAIRPLDRSDWLLENLLVLATASVLIPTYRRFQFSNLSYALILVFLAFPVRELLLRFSGIQRAWSFRLPPAIILAISGFFEILESIVAETVAPGKGVEWLGGQGDEWDAQNDMLAALLGAFVMMAAVTLITRKGTQR